MVSFVAFIIRIPFPADQIRLQSYHIHGRYEQILESSACRRSCETSDMSLEKDGAALIM